MVYQGVRFKICDLEKIKLQIMKKKNNLISGKKNLIRSKVLEGMPTILPSFKEVITDYKY